MRGGKVSILLIIAILGAVAARAAEPAARGGRSRGGAEALTTTKIRGDLYQVSGGGGNTFFLAGPEEVLAIDAKTTPQSAAAFMAEIRKVSDKPVRRLILTHSDGDHVGGLAGLPEGLELVSSAGARAEIENANAGGSNKLPLPAKTFEKELALKLGATEIKLLHFGPAHTSGDTVVFFPSLKVAIVGDLIFIGRDPLIHKQKGGNSFGLVAVQKKMLELDADLFLSGHADPVDKKTVAALTAQIEEKQAKVKELVQQGKTLDEIKKALGVPEATGGRRWPSLVEIIYGELAK